MIMLHTASLVLNMEYYIVENFLVFKKNPSAIEFSIKDSI